MQRCPTPAPWLLYIFLDRGQDLERAKSSAALNLRRVVHVFSADGPWATGRGLLRADFCRSALFFCVEGVQGCHCFSWELSLACRAPGTRAKCMHSKVLKICTNVVLVLVRGSTRVPTPHLSATKPPKRIKMHRSGVRTGLLVSFHELQGPQGAT